MKYIVVFNLIKPFLSYCWVKDLIFFFLNVSTLGFLVSNVLSNISNSSLHLVCCHLLFAFTHSLSFSIIYCHPFCGRIQPRSHFNNFSEFGNDTSFDFLKMYFIVLYSPSIMYLRLFCS